MPDLTRETIGELLELLEGYEDVRDGSDGPMPNKAMQACNLLREALEWRSLPGCVAAEDVQWIVNDIAELGVKIGGQFFFLYKGRSLQYGTEPEEQKRGVCLHDDGRTMHWRPVGKREFGECCHPVNYADIRKCGQPHYIGTVRLDDSDEWMPLPAAPGGKDKP